MVMPAGVASASVTTGKFCRRLGPGSGSPESFDVTPVAAVVDAHPDVGDDRVAEDRVAVRRLGHALVDLDTTLTVTGDEIAGAGTRSPDDVL